MKHLGDITKIHGNEIEKVDLICGGSPCQDLSVAGLRAGLKNTLVGDEDTTRSGLFHDMIRIIKEMREDDRRNFGRSGVDVRPRFVLWENVPGAFSSNKGQDFRCVLEEYLKVEDSSANVPMPADGKWADAGCVIANGCSVSWRVLDAQYWGVPQRRRRIFLVASYGELPDPDHRIDSVKYSSVGCSAEILFKRKSLLRYSSQSREEGQEASPDSTEGA